MNIQRKTMNINKLEALISNSKLNKVQIAKESGISRTTLQKVLEGADVKISTLEALARVLNVPLAEFFGDVTTKVNTDSHVFVDDKRLEHSVVPLYDIDVSAGLQKLFASGGSLLGSISIPNMPGADGAMHVTGDSMYPLIKAGDIVAYRILHDISSISYGEIYILQLEHDSDMQVVVKYVKKAEQPDSVLLVSYNKEHDPMEVPRKWITALARVTFSIRKYCMF